MTRIARRNVTAAVVTTMICLGGAVLWLQQGAIASADKVLTKASNNRMAWVQAGNPVAYLDGVKTRLPVAPCIMDTSMMVPLKPLLEWFGGTVRWEDASRAATITWMPKAAEQAEVGSEAVNGLQLNLSTPQTRYPVGSQCRLDIELKNVSDGWYRIWIPRLAFDIKADMINADGQLVSRNLAQWMGAHDTAAWIGNIVNFTAGMSISLPQYVGRNVPGTVSYTVSYSNNQASLKPETASSKTGDIWVGSVTSNTVTIEFYDDKEQ